MSPILHPIAAAAGQYIGWYPAEDVVVLARDGPRWRVVRRLGFDNIGAVGVHLADGALTCVYVRGEGSALPAGVSGLPRPAQPRTPPLRLVR
jgi:hypothetical protein